MPEPKRHADNRNFLESLLRKIPGFHGYLEKEYRRESDYLARTWLADQLKQGKRDLDDFQRKLVDAGNLDGMTECERLRTRLDGLESRIRGAVRGYSGFFDFVRVDEGLLDRVYELDMSLMKDVESLGESINQLDPDGQLKVRDVLDQLEEMEKKFTRRGEMLQGLAPDGLH